MGEEMFSPLSDSHFLGYIAEVLFRPNAAGGVRHAAASVFLLPAPLLQAAGPPRGHAIGPPAVHAADRARPGVLAGLIGFRRKQRRELLGPWCLAVGQIQR